MLPPAPAPTAGMTALPEEARPDRQGLTVTPKTKEAETGEALTVVAIPVAAEPPTLQVLPQFTAPVHAEGEAALAPRQVRQVPATAQTLGDPVPARQRAEASPTRPNAPAIQPAARTLAPTIPAKTAPERAAQPIRPAPDSPHAVAAPEPVLNAERPIQPAVLIGPALALTALPGLTLPAPRTFIVQTIPAGQPEVSETAAAPVVALPEPARTATIAPLVLPLAAALHPKAIVGQPGGKATPLPPPVEVAAQVGSQISAPVAAQPIIAVAAHAVHERAPEAVAAHGSRTIEANKPAAPTPEAAPMPADAQPAVPVTLQPGADTAPASAPAFATAAVPQRTEAPHDFAALIDRLVEAREAARSSVSPQAVQAAVAHADFGKVELRFEQNGAQLSVSLASSDPDFARAVQAAAPAAQQQDLPRDTGSAPQRHDMTERPSTGSSFAQSQQQPQSQRGQASDPRGEEARSHSRHEPQPRNDARSEARSSRRSGIFA